MLEESTLGGGKQDTKSSNRRFGWVFAGVFALMGLTPLFHGAPPRWWAGVGLLVLVAVTIAAPAALTLPNRLWMRLGDVLHRITSPIMLAVLFYLTVTPMGILMRLVGRDPLRLRRSASESTYWIARNPPGPQPESLKYQF